MAGRWKEVVRLRFTGDRFRDHALDLTALTELRQFQKLVAETARALWRAAHPDRERLPAHFEERTRLCLRRIDEGSAAAPLEVFVEETDQAYIWEPEPTEVTDAISLAYEVFDSAERDQPLPEGFPAELIAEFAEWGKTLGPGEAVELEPAGISRSVTINPAIRERLLQFVERPHADTVEISGVVLEADVRQRRFQLWLDDRTSVAAPFSEAQEELVTSALKEHRSIRMVVRGRVDVSPQGRPMRFTEVEELKLVMDQETPFDPEAPAIEDVLAQIAAQVPADQWKRLPPDLTDQLDHYVYGTPKR